MERMRLFVGLPLSPELAESLASLTQALRPLAPAPCSWIKPGTWHVTLAFLGQTPGERLEAIAAALTQVPFSPFALRLGPAGAFPDPRRPRTLTLGLTRGGPECAALARSVTLALTGAGFLPETRPFTPHVTLARVKSSKGPGRPSPARPGRDARPRTPAGRPNAQTPDNAWDALLAKADAWPLPESAAGCFVLWRSFLAGDPAAQHHGLAGPGHLALGRWPARGEAPAR